MSRKILFAVTSHPQMGPWLEELAAPYRLAVAEGFQALIASPRGGVAQSDPLSVNAPWLTEHGQWFLSDQAAMAKLKGTRALTDVSAAELDAVYLVGGTGTMWDFPDCAPLTALISALATAGKPVAAVCHGVIGLLHARAGDGTVLIKGRALTCFSDAEERMVGMEAVVPLLAETALRRAGANVTCGAPFEAHTVTDGLLLTGQNPASALPLGQALIDKLRA